jgi:hypothetical protein
LLSRFECALWLACLPQCVRLLFSLFRSCLLRAFRYPGVPRLQAFRWRVVLLPVALRLAVLFPVSRYPGVPRLQAFRLMAVLLPVALWLAVLFPVSRYPGVPRLQAFRLMAVLLPVALRLAVRLRSCRQRHSQDPACFRLSAQPVHALPVSARLGRCRLAAVWRFWTGDGPCPCLKACPKRCLLLIYCSYIGMVFQWCFKKG